MDRHWSTTIIRSQVLWSVESHDPIVTTWSISASRKRLAIHYHNIIEECRRKEFDGAPQWLLEDWIPTLEGGGGAKKDFPGFTSVGTSSESTDVWKITVNHRTSHSCQCSTTLYGMQKGNDELCVNDSKTNKEYAVFAVIGLSWGLDPKRSGAELTMENQMDLGIELPRKCCRISKDQVIRYSGAPTP